jgi:hypothetical protein
LEVAGFQDDNDGKLKLVHKNSAILNVVLQVMTFIFLALFFFFLQIISVALNRKLAK